MYQMLFFINKKTHYFHLRIYHCIFFYFLQPNRCEVEKNINKLTPGKPFYFETTKGSSKIPLQKEQEACMLLPNEKFKSEPLYISQVNYCIKK